MSGEGPESAHWNAYAARFKLVGQPLRPGEADVAHLRDVVQRYAAPTPASGQALLLGVTPEIARIAWQPPLRLLAVDQSAGMIANIWPGDTTERRAQVGDWFDLVAPADGFDLVVGDGIFTLLEYPGQYRRLALTLARLLGPAGVFSVRLFCRVEPTETVAEVMQALWTGRIGNFHVFKWRLAMALQGDETRGVQLNQIWSSFVAQTGGVHGAAERTGFPEPEVSTIEGYRGVQDRYWFSTEAELIEALAPELELLESWRGRYELGERCPHLTFRRRG